jgi:hypothetical protein
LAPAGTTEDPGDADGDQRAKDGFRTCLSGHEQGMAWRNHLRLGIIFTVTGIIAFGHAVLTMNGHLPSGVDFIIGRARKRSEQG